MKRKGRKGKIKENEEKLKIYRKELNQKEDKKEEVKEKLQGKKNKINKKGWKLGR